LADAKFRVGCSGWSYKDWAGIFYPKDLPQRDYLKFYSKVFDCVEIDSSFYRVPNASMISAWRTGTPDGFLFSPKLPKKITHENKLLNSQGQLAYFYSVMSKMGSKFGPIAIQLPPSVKVSTHWNAMKDFVSLLDPKFRHAIEFRHKSWFAPETYELLRKNNLAMIWALNQYVETPPELTADFIYVRMVGDRAITEFTGKQRDRTEEMKKWSGSVKDASDKVEDAFIFFNNHFAGFSPESANEFRRLLGMMELEWKSEGTTQQTLFG